MKALLLVAGLAIGTALVSGALLVGQGGGPAGAPSSPAPGGSGPAGADGRGTGVLPGGPGGDGLSALERRVRDLEARLEEIRVRADAVSPPPGRAPGPAVPGGAAEAEGRAEAGAEGDGAGTEERAGTGAGGTGSPGTSDGSLPSDAPGHRGEKPDAARAREARREAEVRRRLDRAAEAMGLGEGEKARAEEIVRAHLERAEAIALRARESLRASPYGFTEADRSVVDQLTQDRARLDRETEQSLVTLVGPDRWKAFLRTEKEQDAKEKALRRLEKPW